MARVKVNQQAIDDLLTDPGVHDELTRRAERVEQQAKTDAPVLTGSYRDSIHLEDGEDGMVRVVADVPYAIYVEADTGNLTRSLDAAGGE